MYPLTTWKSELRFSNMLRNGSMLNKGHFTNFAKIGPMATSLKELGEEVWWKDRENQSSRSWHNLAQVKKEEIDASKIYSQVGKCAERDKV